MNRESTLQGKIVKRRKPVLDRRKVVAAILAQRGDALVMPGLGAPTWDCAAVDDHPLTFYSWGGMGRSEERRVGKECRL